ncbi:MAG: aspartate aminotransferase family protein [Rhodothalassiaceae bacterium]
MSAVMQTYRPADIAFERGEGMYLFDGSGRRYLDFNAGIAVSCLGHAHPRLVAALTEQANKVWHTTNLYTIPGQQRLADRYAAATFADKLFFTNSGAEAIECAIKVARRYMGETGRPERFHIIGLHGAFHGRTLAAINAAGKGEGYGPPLPGFDSVAPGDLGALEAALTDETAAIILEPVQGEGGVVPLSEAYLQGVRALCDRHGLLLILDEVQCGMGRTGKLFAHEWAGITPDIMAIAKGIGGGFPLGACLATDEVAQVMTVGTHGSTYGGNPLAMAVGNAVLDEILAPGFLDRVQQMAEALKSALEAFAKRNHNSVATVRGRGLMLGVKLREGLNNRDVIRHLLSEGLMLAPAGDNVLRFLPPLILEEAHIAEAMEILDRGLAKLADQAA